MRWNRLSVLVYIAVLVTAFSLNTSLAQAVPTWDGHAWTLPANDPGPPMLAAPAQTTGGYTSGVEQWRDEVNEACAVYGCSTDYILSVMACESGGDPTAVGPNGELGLMQIDPAYWGTYGPVESIWFAAQHLTAGDIWWACG